MLSVEITGDPKEIAALVLELKELLTKPEDSICEATINGDCMPAQWTAEILGEMHLAGMSAKQLAAEAGWHEKYLSAVMNGHREPKKAEQTLREALARIKERST